MKLLILHYMPYEKVEYHRGIDHNLHDVTYIGTASSLANIPGWLKCHTHIIPGLQAMHIEIIERLNTLDKKFDQVIAISENELMEAALIRAQFELLGPTPTDVAKVRNKLIMKELVSAAGIKTPPFKSLTEALKNSDTIFWNGKTILKPIEGSKSEGIRVLPSFDELFKFIKNANSIKHFEIEEFIPGDTSHFDGLVCNGKIQVMLASRYIGNCLDFANGHPLGSYQRKLVAGEQVWVSTVLNAVGIRNGCFHLEAIESNDTLLFLEIANRVSGGDVVKTFELATGIHLPSAELPILLGEQAHISPQEISDSFGFFIFPGHALKSKTWEILGTEEFKHLPTIVQWRQLPKTSSFANKITYNSAQSPVAGIVRGNSEQETAHLLNKIISNVKIESK